MDCVGVNRISMGESIAELEANVPAAQRRTAIALVRWRNAVDAYRAAKGGTDV